MGSKVAGRAVLLLLCLVVGEAVRQVSMHKGDVFSAAHENKENEHHLEHEHVQEGHDEAAHSELEWVGVKGQCTSTSECKPNCKCSHNKCHCYR